MKPVIVVAAAGLSLLCPWSATLRGVEALPPAPPPLDPATSLDKGVQPGDDFYHYADGGWLKNNPIPSDHTSWGSFNILTEHNNDVLHVILDDCAGSGGSEPRGAAGSVRKMVGDFYASGMDEAAIDAAGVKPLQPWFDKIAALKSSAELPALLADLHSNGVGALFTVFVTADEKNSETDIAQFYQGGLGLPDRDYYTKTDDASKKLLAAYQEHVTKMFALLGDAPDVAAAEAKSVVSFETELAKASKTRVQLRDPEGNYHKMTVDELAKAAPGFDWKAYFTALGAPEPGGLDVKQPEFATRAADLAKTTSLDDLKTYLRWHLAHSTAPLLSKAFVDENFAFFGTTLTGAKENLPRWKRVLHSVDEGVGEALGQLYVEKNFPPEAKARALTMINDLKAVLRERLTNLEWMGPDTRTAALKKLDAFGVKVGYPDKWRDYSGLSISRQPFVLNVLASNVFETKRQVAKIGHPVDKSEWGMTPPTVNAYYNPSRNEIVFPAGILQPPFFSATADDAVNYGGMGAVIGHEMTHGFDDQGRQYDAQGNLKNWWTDDDLKRFKERSEKVVAQFSGYEPLPGMHVNGELTQGENIADLGGSKIAFFALEKALDRQGPEARAKKIDGFTPEQRFFLSWAQVWRVNMRPEMARVRLNTDPHSPGQFRCNGPLSNLVEFQKAFNIPDGAPMVRPAAEKVLIW